MGSSIDIISDLSREEIEYLKFVPPHTINYDAVLKKNFGIMPPREAFQFHYDLLDFHDSVKRLDRLRKQEMNENRRKNCARCECTKKSDSTMTNKMSRLSFLVHILLVNLQDLNDKVLLNIKIRKMMNKISEKSEVITIVAASNIGDEEDEVTTAAPNIAEEKSEDNTADSNTIHEKSEDNTVAFNTIHEKSEDNTAAFNTIHEKSEEMTDVSPETAEEKIEDITAAASDDEGYDIAGNASPTSLHRAKREQEEMECTKNDPEAPEIVTASSDENDEIDDYVDELDSMIKETKDIFKITTEIYEFML
ncbi:hypothetical protein PV326_001661, partial [Microctonus aethiopoides]